MKDVSVSVLFIYITSIGLRCLDKNSLYLVANVQYFIFIYLLILSSLNLIENIDYYMQINSAPINEFSICFRL